jgi:hypothetical protein
MRHLPATALTLALLFPATAPAQPPVDLPNLASAETRLGTLTLGPADLDGLTGQQLLLNGTPVAGTADRFVEIRAVFPRPGPRTEDWALISLSSGGNGCPALWAFVKLSPETALATELFGTCSEGLLAIEDSPEGTVTLMMKSTKPAELDAFLYSFDGTGPVSVEVIQSMVSPAPQD